MLNKGIKRFIHTTQVWSFKERMEMLLLHIVRMIECMVYVCSLTLITLDIDWYLLFEVFSDEHGKLNDKSNIH